MTRFEYETVEAFRNAGGNLMFLSANNFFWRVVRRGNVMRRSRQWRARGRPESALIGVQYFASDRGSHKRPWVVRDASSAGGLLASVGLQRGNRFGEGGVEVDAITRHSPPKIKVLAELGWRRGRRAQMTYYETWNGAKVFAAGAFSLVLNLHRHDGRELLDELWERLARP